MLRSKLAFLVLLIFVTFSCLACFASEVNVAAAVDKNEVNLDEFLQFTITIEGMGSSYESPKINMPKLEESFSIIASSQSNSMNFHDGKLAMNWQIQYTLLPKKEGELKIGSVGVVYEEESYQTQEISIKVNPSKNPPQQPKKEPLPEKVPWSEEGIFI